MAALLFELPVSCATIASPVAESTWMPFPPAEALTDTTLPIGLSARMAVPLLLVTLRALSGVMPLLRLSWVEPR